MTTSVTDDRARFEAWAKDHLSYDPLTGVMTWAKKPNRNIPLGRSVGKANSWGHISFGHFGHTYMVHRVAWLLTFGNWPVGQIDHINGDPADNRLENLRDVDQSTNMENKRHAHSNNKSGFLGVRIDPRKRQQKYKANIKVKGKSRTIGRFYTAEEAHEAYLQAKRLLHEGCTI